MDKQFKLTSAGLGYELSGIELELEFETKRSRREGEDVAAYRKVTGVSCAVTLDFEGMTLGDVLEWASRELRVAYQNSVLRPAMDAADEAAGYKGEAWRNAEGRGGTVLATSIGDGSRRAVNVNALVSAKLGAMSADELEATMSSEQLAALEARILARAHK
jgi:hypothetical protein